MDKLSITIDNELAIMEKYQISPNELFTIRILLLAKEEYAPEYVFRFLSIPEEMRGILRDTLLSLQAKGVILKSYKIPEKGQQFRPDDVEFAVNFLKTFYRASAQMGQELFEAYPFEIRVGEKTYKLRRVSKKYDSLEDAFRVYGKSIRWNQEKHLEVLSLIKWGIDNGYQFTTLDDFIVDQDWENIKLMKAKGITNEITFDTTKSL